MGMQVDHSNDKKIIDLVIRIMGNGTFVAETINESILFKLLEQRGTPIPLSTERISRDIEFDWNMFLEDGGVDTIPNAPIKQV